MGVSNFIIKLSVKLRRHRWNIAIFVGILILVDFLLRIWMPLPVYTYFYTRENASWAEDPELFWLPGKRYAPEKKVIRKTPSKSLIYTFGGSILTSHEADTNFPEQLQHCLGDKMTVVNFGTGGYTSHQSLVNYKRLLKLKAPAITVVCHAFNDNDNEPRSDIEMSKRNEQISIKLLYYLSKSRMVSLLRKGLRKAYHYDPYTLEKEKGFVARVSPEEFERNILEFAKLAKENQSALVLMSQGNVERYVADFLDRYFQIMQKVAANHRHVYYLEVRPPLEKPYIEAFGQLPGAFDKDKHKLLHVDGCHLNNEGHQIVGKMLCDFLIEKDLVTN